VGAGAAGLASGSPAEKIEVNIGYTGVRGQSAAEKAADSVSRRFGFDAITAEVPKNALKGLSKNPNIRYIEENGRMHAIDPIDSTGGPPGSCEPWPDCDKDGGGGGGDTSQSLEWGVDRVDAAPREGLGEGFHRTVLLDVAHVLALGEALGGLLARSDGHRVDGVELALDAPGRSDRGPSAGRRGESDVVLGQFLRTRDTARTRNCYRTTCRLYHVSP
jgi:hypothetical protein